MVVACTEDGRNESRNPAPVAAANEVWRVSMAHAKDNRGYNERLFSSGFRGLFHFARFEWIKSRIEAMRCPVDSVLELGCYDGKIIDYLPKVPERYVGYDANWDDGLELARSRWKGEDRFSFRFAARPEDIVLEEDDRFDIAVSMETLEHVPPEMVEGYLSKIARHCRGHLFVTVPNEKGLAFLLRHCARKWVNGDAQSYSFPEFVNASLGRLSRVTRADHKGFDYAELLKQIERHFDVIHVSGHPFPYLPRHLWFGVGIVARAKTGPRAPRGNGS